MTCFLITNEYNSFSTGCQKCTNSSAVFVPTTFDMIFYQCHLLLKHCHMYYNDICSNDIFPNNISNDMLSLYK